MSPNNTPPNAKEIIRKYLFANGYDGLKCGRNCNCTFDDLLNCLNVLECCTPGYLNQDPGCPLHNRIRKTQPKPEPPKEPKP